MGHGSRVGGLGEGGPRPRRSTWAVRPRGPRFHDARDGWARTRNRDAQECAADATCPSVVRAARRGETRHSLPGGSLRGVPVEAPEAVEPQVRVDVGSGRDAGVRAASYFGSRAGSGDSIEISTADTAGRRQPGEPETRPEAPRENGLRSER